MPCDDATGSMFRLPDAMVKQPVLPSSPLMRNAPLNGARETSPPFRTKRPPSETSTAYTLAARVLPVPSNVTVALSDTTNSPPCATVRMPSREWSDPPAGTVTRVRPSALRIVRLVMAGAVCGSVRSRLPAAGATNAAVITLGTPPLQFAPSSQSVLEAPIHAVAGTVRIRRAASAAALTRTSPPESSRPYRRNA